LNAPTTIAISSIGGSGLSSPRAWVAAMNDSPIFTVPSSIPQLCASR
jgi:hypothetical protein